MFESMIIDAAMIPRPRVPWEAEAASAVPAYNSGPVSALVAAVSAVVTAVPSQLPAAQALSDAATLLVLVQVERMRAALLDRIADVDHRQLYADDGAPSTGAWVAQQQTSIDRSEVALARRLAVLPRLAEAVRSGELAVETAGRVGRALSKLRRHVDRPDGLIDGQDGELVVTAVVVDGVRQLVCEALGGLDAKDRRLVSLVAELTAIVGQPAGQLARLEEGFVVLARRIEPGLVPAALGQLVDAILPNELEQRAEHGRGARVRADAQGRRVRLADHRR